MAKDYREVTYCRPRVLDPLKRFFKLESNVMERSAS